MVMVMVAECVALPPTAAAVAVTVVVPRGVLGPAGADLEMEPQPAPPRKNAASINRCSQRGDTQRERFEGDKTCSRPVIESRDKARKGVRSARMDPRPNSELAGEAKGPALFNQNWTVRALLLPSTCTLAGENVQVANWGSPEQVNATGPVYAPTGVSVKFAVPVWPRRMVRAVGLAVIE